MRQATLVILVAILALAACAGVGPTPTPSPSPSPTPAADEAVIRIEQVGGMLPPWMSANWYPAAVLYTDGRLVTPGPQIDLYPGPALPNLQVTQLTGDGVGQLLAWAVEAGLIGPDRTLGEPILDAPVTVFSVLTEAGLHRTTLQGPNGDPAVVALLRFQDALVSARSVLPPDDVLGEDRPYPWTRMQIVSVAMDPARAPDPQLVTLRDWPLAGAPLSTPGRVIEPATGHRCAVIEGDDAEILRAALEGANQLTMWVSEDQTFEVIFHPLLPDDEGCAGL